MDIEKAFEEFIEKEWHDGHEPQGGHDHYDEDEKLDEKKSLKLRDLNFYPTPKKKGKKVSGSSADRPMAFGISRKGGSGPGKGYGSAKKAPILMGDEIEEDLNLIAVSEDMCDLKRGELSSDPMKAAWDKKCGGGEKKKKHTISTPSLRGVYDKAEFDPFIEEALGEGYKDLPPHLQKLVKKIEKKQKDWNKQNPNAKIKTLVYNPETGKPDIVVKENTMKLEDTVKQVLTGKPKLEEHCGVCDEQGIEEDSDKDTPGTQGDMKKYQAARAKVMKKFGVKSCSELEGDEKKACYAALDAAHVSDDEEEKGEKKEEVKKSYSKMFSHIKSLMQGK